MAEVSSINTEKKVSNESAFVPNLSLAVPENRERSAHCENEHNKGFLLCACIITSDALSRFLSASPIHEQKSSARGCL
jgi:hypothetical protein